MATSSSSPIPFYPPTQESLYVDVPTRLELQQFAHKESEKKTHIPKALSLPAGARDGFVSAKCVASEIQDDEPWKVEDTETKQRRGQKRKSDETKCKAADGKDKRSGGKCKRRKSGDSDKENAMVVESEGEFNAIEKAQTRSRATSSKAPEKARDESKRKGSVSCVPMSKSASESVQISRADTRSPLSGAQTKMKGQITKPNALTLTPKKDPERPVFKIPPALSPSPPRFKQAAVASPHRFKTGSTRPEAVVDEWSHSSVIVLSSSPVAVEKTVEAQTDAVRSQEEIKAETARQSTCFPQPASMQASHKPSSLQDHQQIEVALAEPINLAAADETAHSTRDVAPTRAHGIPCEQTHNTADNPAESSREEALGPKDPAQIDQSRPLQPTFQPPKPIPKHLRTVTGAAIAHYGLDNPQIEATTASTDFFSPRPYDAKELLTGEQSQQRPKKKSSRKKQPPPPAKLLDPEQMARRMRKQDSKLLFGTSSQLAGSPSPETYRNLQRAIKESEETAAIVEDVAATVEPVVVDLTARLSNTVVGTRSLWASATRDENNKTYTPPPRAAPVAPTDTEDVDLSSDDDVRIVPEQERIMRSGSGSTLRLASGSDRKKRRLLCHEEFGALPMPTPFSNQQRAFSTSASTSRSPEKAVSRRAASPKASSSKAKTSNKTVKKDGASLSVSKARKTSSAAKAKGPDTPKRARGRPKKDTGKSTALIETDTKKPKKRASKKKDAKITANEEDAETLMQIVDCTDDLPPNADAYQFEDENVNLDPIDGLEPLTPSPPRVRPTSLGDKPQTLDLSPSGTRTVAGADADVHVNADADGNADPLSTVNARAATLAARNELTEDQKKKQKREDEARKRAEHKIKQNEQLAILFPQITRAVEAQPRSKNAQLKIDCWYEKMLMYEPIVLEEFTTWLNRGALHDLGNRTEAEDETMQNELGVGEKGVLRLGDRGFVKEKGNIREVEAGKGLRGRLMPWAVQRWCEDNSICAVYRDGVWAGNRRRRGL